eukprot:COSAG01_NODE_32165_length_585_cov_1.166667_1_plen_50_part_01
MSFNLASGLNVSLAFGSLPFTKYFSEVVPTSVSNVNYGWWVGLGGGLAPK